MKNHIHKFLSNFNLKLMNELNIQLIFFIKYCNFKGVFKEKKNNKKKLTKTTDIINSKWKRIKWWTVKLVDI